MSPTISGSHDEAHRRERAMNGAHGAMLLFRHKAFRGEEHPELRAEMHNEIGGEGDRNRCGSRQSGQPSWIFLHIVALLTLCT